MSQPPSRDHSRAAPGLITVVVPVRDAEQTIAAQLEALAAQTYEGDWELVVSDNGSTDRTLEIAGDWSARIPSLRVADSSAQRGAAHARNAGASAAGELIAFCDADDVVTPNWLAELVAALEGADIVGGALEHELLNDPATVDWRGGGESDLPRTLHFLPNAISCNCALRRSVWRELGGWSDRYWRGSGEDVELSWRAQLKGFRIAFAPGAVVHYRHRTGLHATARQVYVYAQEEVQLLRDFRAQGASRRTAREVGASYLYLLTRLPYLFLTRRKRGFWVVRAADNLGRLTGSVRYRVFAP